MNLARNSSFVSVKDLFTSAALVLLPIGVAFGDAASDAAAVVLRVVDPGVRGGMLNTGGGYQQRGLPIPPPPVIRPHPVTGAAINRNRALHFRGDHDVQGLREMQLRSSLIPKFT